MRYGGTTYVWAVCGLAILYYLAGRLGLLLAIPPGYATAVWPPSGMALAALLLFGARVWPGIFIGSLVLNVWTSLDPADPSSTLRSLLIAISIAAGSTFQALLGQRMVRWIGGGPASKPWEGRRAASLAVGGPIACITGATVGVGTLVLTGAIPPASAPYSWVTWYVGDTIGVVIFTPILLLWAARPNRIPLRQRLAVSAPLVVTFTLVVLLFTRVNALEQRQIRMEFEGRSGALHRALQRGVDRTLDALREAGDIHDGWPRVDPARFRASASALLERHPELDAIAWSERVPHARRAAFEAELRGESHVLGIMELDFRNQLVPSAERGEYVVLRYIEPLRPNREAPGFDVASDAVRRRALALARESGAPACVPPIPPVLGLEDQAACMVVLPVYRKQGRLSTRMQGAGEFAGAMAAVVRVGRLTETLLHVVHSPGIQVTVADAPGRWESRRQRPAPFLAAAHLDAAPREDPPAGRAGLRQSAVLDIAGHRWRVQYSMGQEYLEAHRSWLAWGILAAGMAFTGLLGAYILSLLGQSANVERLVTLRTEELRRAHDEAKTAQLQLVQAAKLESIGRLAAGVAHEVKNPLAVILFAVDYLRDWVHSPDPNVATALKDAREAVVRADTVIRDLLDFSTGAELKPSMQDVNNLLLKALVLVRHALTRSHVVVTEELATGLPPVLLDGNKIEQVLVNLLINAVDAMPDGGSLIVRSRQEMLMETGPDVGARSGDRFRVGSTVIVVEIEDSGAGIPEESLARLFDPFYTTKPAGKGSGLGLAICKSIIALHGGTIAIANREGGGGARATIVLRSTRPEEEGNADG